MHSRTIPSHVCSRASNFNPASNCNLVNNCNQANSSRPVSNCSRGSSPASQARILNTPGQISKLPP